MHLLQTLPTEITGYIFLTLDNPSDLLHLALTCKAFYELIVPTRHLDLTSISCCDSETPPKFWETLCVSRHYASMVRNLEICDRGCFEMLSRRPRRYCGRRIDDEFAQLSSDFPLHAMVASSYLELFFQSLSYMEGLKSIFILKCYSEEGYELSILLPHLLKNFSNTLETLHIHYEIMTHPKVSIPQSRSYNYSFNCLTSFSIKLPQARVPEPFDLLLKTLASSCHTLVNFALQLISHEPLSCIHLVKNATWPLLRRLTLVGPLSFSDNNTSPEESINLCLSFFERHARLERLYLSKMRNLNRSTGWFLSESGWRLPDVLPSLQSLHLESPISFKIVPRLVHISNKPVSPYNFSYAQSLHSCILAPIDLYPIEAIVKNVPQLERLSVTFEVSKSYTENFGCFWDGLPTLITKLQNLTHLELYVISNDLEDTCRPEGFLDYLPRLSYVHVWSDTFEREWLGITADPDDPNSRQLTSLRDSPDQSFRSEFWGGFFAGPAMEFD